MYFSLYYSISKFLTCISIDLICQSLWNIYLKPYKFQVNG